MNFVAWAREPSESNALGAWSAARFAAAIAAAALLALWLASTAQAAVVGSGGNPTFADIDYPGEVNTVTLVRIGDSYKITDTTATITASGPCSVDATGHIATCPVPAEGTYFGFYLGGLNDTLSNQSADAISINGGEGDDLLTGGSATDFIFGGAGHDQITAGGGGDEVFGDEGNDEIDGGAGDDSLRGGPSDDLLEGGDGNDNLNGDSGDDDMFGGPGQDTAYYGYRSYWVEVSLDGQANDGEEFEFDYVADDVEEPHRRTRQRPADRQRRQQHPVGKRRR